MPTRACRRARARNRQMAGPLRARALPSTKARPTSTRRPWDVTLLDGQAQLNAAGPAARTCWPVITGLGKETVR